MASGETISAGQDADFPATRSSASGPKKGRKKILIIGAVVLLLGGVGAAYATGMFAKLGATEAHSELSGIPGSVDLPPIMANLNAGPRRTAFVRLKARLELSSKADEAAVGVALPKIQDLFQTYLRDMRPDELRGSAGTYRLREELIARANIAIAPARVTEILFIEMLVQ